MKTSKAEKYQIVPGKRIGPFELNMDRESVYQLLEVDQQPITSLVETYGNGGLSIVYNETTKKVTLIQVDRFAMEYPLYLDRLEVFSHSFAEIAKLILTKDPNASLDPNEGTIRSESLGIEMYTNKSEDKPPYFVSVFLPRGDKFKINPSRA